MSSNHRFNSYDLPHSSYRVPSLSFFHRKALARSVPLQSLGQNTGEKICENHHHYRNTTTAYSDPSRRVVRNPEDETKHHPLQKSEEC
ncbi:unnamed protein product [Lactuca virosa]|uniref:Uncharacterized protein n=1 Tax=Lactuca virosa TaxID=75947 RepID=A0AAU9LZJ5_9ASTR|nr:unnamed protein product [Lactuca virosa]